MTTLTSSSNIIDTHTWNHVCFTYNKYNSNISLFVNNELVSTNNIDFNIKDIVSDVDFNIGYNHTLGSNNYFEGKIDEIVLYNTVLDKQHIEYISNPNNSLQFLKNNVNRISINPITKTLNVIDTSDSNVSPTIVGDVVISSDITYGLKSMKFTGDSHISIQNDGIDPKLFSIGTWVNPTDNINQTFIKKEGVFELGTNEFGNIRFDINDVPSDQLKYVKNTMNKYYKKIHPPIYNDTLSWWMDASDLSTIEKDDNGYVTSWTSKGSFMLGLDTYSNTKKIPVSHNTLANHVTHNEELGYMLFNDTAYFQYFDSDFFYDTSFTCFIKYSMDTLDNSQCIFGNDAGGSGASTAYAILRYNNNGTKTWDGWSSTSTISVDDDTNVHTYVIRYDNDGTIGKSSIDSKTIWFDGEVQINTGTYRADLTGSTRTNQMKGTIGLAHGNNTVHTNILNGKIFSILWYNSVLTDDEVGQTLDYINEKVPTNLDELNTSYFEFNDSMTDSKNPDFVAQGENISFKKSFNQIAHKCVELNGDSSINLGKVFENVSNPNQMTISTWVNLKDLQGNQPLMSVFGGFEWWINKYDGPENSELNSVINFYIPNKPKSFNFTNVSLNENVYDIDFTIDTTIDTQYYMVAFASKQELNSSLIVQFASLQGDIKGSVTGTLENISTFVQYVFNNDGTIYDITSVNDFFIYLFVKGGELNELNVIESHVSTSLGGQISTYPPSFDKNSLWTTVTRTLGGSSYTFFENTIEDIIYSVYALYNTSRSGEHPYNGFSYGGDDTEYLDSTRSDYYDTGLDYSRYHTPDGLDGLRTSYDFIINTSRAINIKQFIWNANGVSRVPKEYKIEVSNDGETWHNFMDYVIIQYSDSFGKTVLDIPKYTGLYTWVKFVFSGHPPNTTNVSAYLMTDMRIKASSTLETVDTNPVISYKYAVLNLDTNVIDINTSVYNTHYDLLDCYVGVFHPDFDINSISESDLVNNLLINQSTLSTGLYKVSNKAKSNVHTLYNQFTNALIYTDGTFSTAPIEDLQYSISTILRFNDILVIDTYTNILIKDQQVGVSLLPSIISSVSKDEINKTLTINAQIFSTYANITSIKLVVIDSELEATKADISTMTSMVELPTLNMNNIFQLNETISTYYTDLSGNIATITDVDAVKYFIYVVDINENVLIHEQTNPKSILDVRSHWNQWTAGSTHWDNDTSIMAKSTNGSFILPIDHMVGTFYDLKFEWESWTPVLGIYSTDHIYFANVIFNPSFSPISTGWNSMRIYYTKSLWVSEDPNRTIRLDTTNVCYLDSLIENAGTGIFAKVRVSLVEYKPFPANSEFGLSSDSGVSYYITGNTHINNVANTMTQLNNYRSTISTNNTNYINDAKNVRIDIFDSIEDDAVSIMHTYTSWAIGLGGTRYNDNNQNKWDVGPAIGSNPEIGSYYLKQFWYQGMDYIWNGYNMDTTIDGTKYTTPMTLLNTISPVSAYKLTIEASILS